MISAKQILLCIGLSALFSSCTKDVDGYRPKVSPMTESIYASVTVEPEDMYDVFAAVPGILEHLHIQAGDSVLKDQLIAEIQATASSIAMENASLSASLARENLEGSSSQLLNIRKEIDTKSEQLRIDSLNYERQKRLWEKKIGSLTDLENRKLKYEMSSNEMANLRRRLEQTENDLRTGYRQSQNSLRNAQSNLADFSVRSRIDGRVYDILKEEGELISLQTPIARIGRSDSFVIEMLVDEIDIARLQPGQTTYVTLDAYPGKVFKAEIKRINPQKDERNQTFLIEALFIDGPEKLYAGLSGEANIVLAKKDNTLTIPLEYLIDGNKVKTEDGEVTVRTGMRNIEVIEIISGLDSTDVIFKP